MLCKSLSLLALSVSTVVAKPYLHARFHYAAAKGSLHAHGALHSVNNTATLPEYTVTVSALPASDSVDSATATDATSTTSCTTTESTSTVFVTSTNHVTVTLASVSSTAAAASSSSSASSSASSSVSSVVVVAAQNVQPDRTSTTFATSVAATVSTASSSAAASTSSTTSSSTGSKKGIAFNDASLTSHFSNIGWTYNWDMQSWTGSPSNGEYVPMCWGLAKAPSCYSNKPAGAKAILSFNEPDNSGQSFMSVSDAVTNHIKYIATPFAGQVRIGSPAVTNSGTSGQGLDYLSQFLAGCAGNCKLDFLAIHWYADSLSNFQQHVTDAINLGAKYGINKIWITEFALTGSVAEQAAFVPQATAWLESQSAVERYAYFWAAPFDNQWGMFSGSSLNSIGQAYSG